MPLKTRAITTCPLLRLEALEDRLTPSAPSLIQAPAQFTGGTVTPYALTLDADGNRYMAATLAGTSDFDPGAGARST